MESTRCHVVWLDNDQWRWQDHKQIWEQASRRPLRHPGCKWYVRITTKSVFEIYANPNRLKQQYFSQWNLRDPTDLTAQDEELVELKRAPHNIKKVIKICSSNTPLSQMGHFEYITFNLHQMWDLLWKEIYAHFKPWASSTLGFMAFSDMLR